MSFKKWKTIDTSIHTDNGYWEYRIDRFSIDDSINGKYHYIHTGGSTMVVPVTDNGSLLLVNQHRYLNKRDSIEFPCGGMEKNLTKEENAIKELREETGFTSNALEYIGAFNPYNGVTDEMCYVYIARNLTKKPLPADTTEEFQLIEFSNNDFEHAVAENQIWDGMTIAAYFMAMKRKGTL